VQSKSTKISILDLFFSSYSLTAFFHTANFGAVSEDIFLGLFIKKVAPFFFASFRIL